MKNTIKFFKWCLEIHDWYKEYGAIYKKALEEDDIETLKSIPPFPPPPDDGE